jgi:YegS/Rv2252/BmrU family lipid kinase
VANRRNVFIVNPNAGNGSTGSKWPEIKTAARDRLGDFSTFITGGPGDAGKYAARAIAEGAEQVVCVGGDGTLNEVVNGFMEYENSIRAGIKLGFIPNGTGCDFVKTVPIPRDTAEAINVIAESHTRCVDVGRLLYQDHNGREGCRYFHNITSFGIGGEVAQRVNRTSKPFGPFIAFIWATLLAVFLYGKKRVSVTVDNEPEKEFVVWNVAVANGQYHGGGMRIAPGAAIDDGLFHLTVVGDLSLAEVLINLPRLYNGRIECVKKVLTLTGKKIKAVSEEPVLLDVDGEQPGMLPAVIDLIPGALNIIVAGR